MKRTLVLLVVIIGLFITGCAGETQETGTLSGRVTIGPISPVERAGEKAVVPPEVYAARKVMVYEALLGEDKAGTASSPEDFTARQAMVYDKNMNKLVKQVDLEPDGHYSVKLQTGIYTIDINHIGIDSSRDVPKKVVIRTGETVKLDIAIDTGIR
ncbi:MAG: hypothetical protein HY528_05100 [Chloroflexi bacterium]|nr:hypothetical protein [Chloroflexota bacterium]